MKVAAASAVKKWVEKLYAEETTTTRVDTTTRNIGPGAGMPVLEYWTRWQEKEGIWVHDDVLPTVSIDEGGVGPTL